MHNDPLEKFKEIEKLRIELKSLTNQYAQLQKISEHNLTESMMQKTNGFLKNQGFNLSNSGSNKIVATYGTARIVFDFLIEEYMNYWKVVDVNYEFSDKKYEFQIGAYRKKVSQTPITFRDKALSQRDELLEIEGKLQDIKEKVENYIEPKIVYDLTAVKGPHKEKDIAKDEPDISNIIVALVNSVI